ncbi:MAG: hypothetical protein ACRD0G_06580 [Acidimicrobiales bacterium]
MIRARRTARVLAVALAAAPLFVAAPVGASGPQPLEVHTDGSGGHGRSTRPGLSCANGGQGASWHYEYLAPVPGGVLSSLPSELGMHLDVHRDEGDGIPAGTTPAQPAGWLAGEHSYATLANQRGSVVLALGDGGGCGAATAVVTPSDVVTSGTWSLARGTGAYREATGSGSFTVAAGIAPGADNPWRLDLGGTITVLEPSLDAEVVQTYWGNLGVDYLTRIVSVVVQVTNAGPGDAFDVELVAAPATTTGVELVGGVPAELRDLGAGESAHVVLRYHLPLDPLGACALVVLGCEFDAELTASMPDALDVADAHTDAVHVTAPVLPPPL